MSSSDQGAAAERLATWRAVIASGLAKTVALLMLPAIVWLSFETVRLNRPGAFWTLLAFQASSVACAIAPIHARARAWWLSANLVILCWGLVPLGGMGAGFGAVLTLVSVLAALLLGVREASATLAVSMAGLLCWLGLVGWRVLPRPPLAISDVGDQLNALRTSIVTLCVACIALAATSYLIRRLTGSLLESERLIVDLRAEIAAKEAEARRRKQAEGELIRAQKIEALGRVAGGVAHDVNNNLTVALACVGLIERRTGENAEMRKLCATISDAVGNSSVLLRQLLSLGRRDVSRPELVTLESVLSRLASLLPSVLGPQTQLTVSLPPDLPPLYVDPRQLEQVLLNLAINARDAMPEGGALSIWAESGGGPRTYALASAGEAPSDPLRIHVKDTGTGIDGSVLPNILDAFFTTKGPDYGTGLGLAVARAFAEVSGGRLCVETVLGRGSTFTLELPSAPVAARATTTAMRNAVQVSATVLVVEADARIRAAMVSELLAAGYRVLEAVDGADALEQAKTAPTIDLLCTDAMMPRGAGDRLIERIAKLHRETRVLVCSAYVPDEGLRNLLRAGRYALLPKPFSPGQLRQAVAGALDSPGRANEGLVPTEEGHGAFENAQSGG